MMKATGALTILLLSTTYSSPVLDLNFGENIGKEKSSGFDATEKADLTSGWVDQQLDLSCLKDTKIKPFHPKSNVFIQFSTGEESLGRYIALVSSVGSWFNNIEWKKYGDYSHYLTLPGKGLPLYFNGTSATLHAVLGNLAAVGISKFLSAAKKPRVSTLKARPVGRNHILAGIFWWINLLCQLPHVRLSSDVRLIKSGQG